MAGDRPLRARADARDGRTPCAADYERFEFHLVVQRLQTFCSEDLGGFYLDILKDRLYTAGEGVGAARRSAQSALHHITQMPAAPDGADPVLHRRGGVGGAASRASDGQRVLAHLERRAADAGRARRRCAARWKRLREIRAAGARRSSKSCAPRAASARRCRPRSTVDAPAARTCDAAALASATTCASCSSPRRPRVRERRGEAPAIEVAPSAHAKCERCWHYRADVGARCRASDAVRALRGQPRRRGRGARAMRERVRAGCAGSLVSVAVVAARPRDQGVDQRRVHAAASRSR